VRLGPYEILGPLGEGGMGVVYRARDTRLDRIVAVKVLPPELAADSQFRERFEREARVIASLSHPHICPLFDIGHDSGVDFLVMEYLEGETLASRLEKGAVPFDHALTIAIEIATALDTAHRAGIIHRDLKPGNIFLTKNGARLLDFGLAKANPGRIISSTASRSLAGVPTALPTTPPAATMTAQGTILGTFQYMAPEQLEGHEADSRTDIFAFGCVLYEMVTGRKAFQGRTQVSLIGAILKDDPPPVSTVQAMSPAAFDFVVRKCLAKDPDRRWQTASDLFSQLEWIAQGGGAAPLTPAMDARATVPRGISPALAASVAVALAAIAGTAAWFLKPVPVAAPRPVPITRFQITLPPDQSFTRLGRHFVTISPDGTKIVYVANQQLYLRAIDQIDATPIRGTNIDPINPFFSPDSQWIGFYASGQLKKIAIAGGAAVKLCDATNPFGASWTGERILFGQGPAGIMEVSANGGMPKLIAKVEGNRGEVAHGPQLLPGGDHVLFTISQGQQWEDARAVVQSLKTGERKMLLEGATDTRYVETGHLLYGHDATMLAVPFDVQRLEVKGGPAAVIEGVTESIPTGSMQFDVSRTGTVTFVPGTIAAQRTLVWVDRQGKEDMVPVVPRPFGNLRISPDGKRVAVEVTDQEQAIWIWEFMRGTLTRLTFGRGSDSNPVWSPDGRRVLYSSMVDGERSVVWKAADGTGAAERLTRGAEAQNPRSITPDGKLLVVTIASKATGLDLGLVSMEGQHDVQPLLHSSFDENLPEISPNGRWIAYMSSESGTNEIYVRPFPEVDKGRWQVSAGGGSRPRWSRDGRELYFSDSPGINAGPSNMMATPIRADGSTFVWEKPVALFPRSSYGNYDIAANGRFLMVKFGRANQQQAQIVIVQNWLAELKIRVAAQ
jgi:eukaryotic-like serine/threonine-protein kinase